MFHFVYSDLSDVMHKVHETFIALAAQLHEFHEAVKVRLYAVLHHCSCQMSHWLNPYYLFSQIK